jgi:polyphosphate kinase
MKKTAKPTFFNRELSWVEFNRRVLELACEEQVPLLERLKFLAITASNLDEFFMVRVGELHLLLEQHINIKDISGLSPIQQLSAVTTQLQAFAQEQGRCFSILSQKLANEDIRRLMPGKLSPEQILHAEHIFTNEILPILTPIAVPTTGHMLLLAGRTIHLSLRMISTNSQGAARFVVIPIPGVLNRIVPLPTDNGYVYMLLEDLIEYFGVHSNILFPGESCIECIPFRITRNAAMRVEDEVTSDLLSDMTELLTERLRSDCVRLEISKNPSSSMTTFLQKGFRIRKDAVFFTSDVLDYAAFMRLTQIPDFAALKNKPCTPYPLLLSKKFTGMFDAVSARDILLHHPYESFDPVVRFLEEAAEDPDVISIKQTLYRAGRKSRIVDALERAAENGKYVTAIVELKARFDEERNIGWARRLEDAGVQVIYGIKGFKTHAKISLVIRKEMGAIKKYAHFGTGNYNELTAQLYTDISLFTCHEDITSDASLFFNVITGHSQPQVFRRAAASPIDLRETIIGCIEAETVHARAGREALIVAKMNALTDEGIIRALYAASQAGVTIKLNIRGACCLRPGIPGLSTTISVVSIIDRFLEHSRIFLFSNDGNEKMFISSADWMPRNLDKRCEFLLPVFDPQCRKRLKEILDTCLHDNTNSWKLLPGGIYKRNKPASHKKIRCQEQLFANAGKTATSATRSRRTEFEPLGPRRTD